MRRKVQFKGKDASGTVVSFSVISQDWNEYALNDGTTIRVQLAVTEVLRIEGEYSGDGDPVYMIKSQNIVTCSNIPDHLRQHTDDSEQGGQQKE